MPNYTFKQFQAENPIMLPLNGSGPPPVPLPWSICPITPPGPDQPAEIEFEDSLRFDLSVDSARFWLGAGR